MLMLNHFTRNLVEFQPVSILNGGQLEDMPSKLAVYIDFELQSIRHGWILLKERRALKWTNPGQYYDFNGMEIYNLAMADGSSSIDKYSNHSIYPPLLLSEKNGIPVLIAALVLVWEYAVLLVVDLRVIFEFWTGPVSDFDSISRASLILWCANSMFCCLYSYLDEGIWNKNAMFAVFIVLALLFHNRCLFSGLRIPTWFARRIKKEPVVETADAKNRAAVDQQNALVNDQNAVVVTEANQHSHIIKSQKEADSISTH
ncbi:hypothetical protein BX661DRAFT_95055 [Kickxella alabastrina]|uniref:uncharacterized protein n=1 Tax=Kickxella alabastrina TaxID=61397 RepID=UPI00221FEF22|nr:uncharacterized protein BX661DRAFT_95055 [Kickxella alabastrina]KAI7829891.1 hypothetical protein BX661DRAFT_95055 [Kickxella alabastrina]